MSCNKYYDGFLRFIGNSTDADKYYKKWAKKGSVVLPNGKICKMPSMLCNKRGNGHKMTEEHKQILRERNKLHIFTDEQKEKLRIAAINYQKKYGNPMQGRKHTLEARRKIVEANLSRTTCKGKLHYLFKGKAGNARGQSWQRKRKEFLDKCRDENNGKLICECNGEIIKGNKADPVIVHHLINTKKVIDVVQDFNYEWNFVLLCARCHTKLHNRLRGFCSKLPKQFILNYNQRASKAKEKMKELLNDAKKG